MIHDDVINDSVKENNVFYLVSTLSNRTDQNVAFAQFNIEKQNIC